MPAPTPLLPILDRRADIEAALRSHQVIVLCGETGSGKTTQLPQIVLDLDDADPARARAPKLIGHTQPRRLAARAVATRIAEERNERLGASVGVKVRFQDQTSPRTRIKLMTDGILLAELSGDPDLRAYGTIIIDEAHERSLNVDFLLGYLKTLLPRRPDLRLIVTSATIDPVRFSAFFGGPKIAPVIEVSGRTYPVEIRYRPMGDDEDAPDRINYEALADAVEELTGPRAPDGDILTFLPGEREIRLAGETLSRRGLDLDILPLFSRLTDAEQDRIFHPRAGGSRRVILATNVAETSLTVPGIRSVVDTGVARQSRYDPAKKIARLPIEPVSRASANQRSGRCGRVAAGVCIRLYSSESFERRPIFTDPEIRRTNLAGAILRMKSLGKVLGEIDQFPFIDPPSPAALEDGYATLFELGAMQSQAHDAPLTHVGLQMAQIPTDPRVARMLIAAANERVLEPVTILAAVLSIQDPRDRPHARQDDADRAHSLFRHETSDFLTLLKLWDQYNHARETLSGGQLMGWCRDHFISPARMREWSELAHQLASIVSDMDLKTADDHPTEDAIHRALLTGLITNVACREGDGSFDYRAIRGNVVQLFPGSVLFRKGPKWIMAAELVQTSRLYARTVAKVDPTWIEELAGHVFQRQLSDPHLDPDTGEPSAWERVSLSGVVVVPRRRTSLVKADPAAARRVFIREALSANGWKTDLPFMQANVAAQHAALAAQAKLRRRDVLIDQREVEAWFEQHVPAGVNDPVLFTQWYEPAAKTNPSTLILDALHRVREPARNAFDPTAFPDTITIESSGEAITCDITYALAPGKDDDGLTLHVPLLAFADLPPARTQWLVPGFLPELIQSLIKNLPKPLRASLESASPLAELAASLAEVMEFAAGDLSKSLSEAVQVLHGIEILPSAWNFKSLPQHLRLQIAVIDDESKPIATDRDLDALLKRLDARIKKARSTITRAAVEKTGLTTWDFPDLPPITTEPSELGAKLPVLLDRGSSVTLTVTDSPAKAAALTPLGIRRLFAIAASEEVGYYIDALSQWSSIRQKYAQLGTEAELRDHLTLIIADRTFLDSQPAIRTRADFEARKEANWGKLSTSAREVGDVVARILEPRAKVAHRLSSGTNRLWASSIADLREQAAYLMPRGFLTLIMWDRLKHYPRYSQAMHDRLFALREEGSKPELAMLEKFEPHWKKFTAWVAAAMSKERTLLAEQGDAADARVTRDPKSKTPLPQARRAAPTVNLDAGEWAMSPRNLPPTVAHYRWLLEELRLSLFTPALALTPPTTPAEAERSAVALTAPARI
jgi:ATP-dependent helicase HrpA